MASTFELEIVTPDRILYQGTVEMVVVRTMTGDVGIKKEHMSMVSPLSIGAVKIKEEKGKYKEAACSGGFVQVRQEKTTIITDSAEFPEEIDVERAKKAADRAQGRLKMSASEIDTFRAQIALEKALNRLNVAKKD